MLLMSIVTYARVRVRFLHFSFFCSIRNSSGPPGNRERMADKDSSQSLKHAMTLLTHGGEIAADATKRRQSGLTAKGARNLLLHLDHAQVALGLIVGKGNGQIVQKGQDLH